MKDLNKRVEEIQALFKKHRRLDLKELPTRTIFIDPLLGSLGWDVRDPDEVELEYPTIDGKSVDYALKINKKVVALVEAKALNDPLDDVKSITQIVGYAANDGVEWCVLTNGIRWKVYSSSQKTTAPNKLLFEVSLIPEEASEQSTEQIASQLARLSRESLAQGVLDQLGEIVFTTAKVRKALDRLFMEPDKLINLVRKNILDDSVSKAQIRFALQRIWPIEGSDKFSKETTTAKLKTAPRKTRGPREQIEYGEEHHTSGKPAEVVELYRALDRICQDFSPGQIIRRHLAKYIAWTHDKKVFCSGHLQHSGLRIWLKIDPNIIPPDTLYARDVSHVGHWGVGDVELKIKDRESLRDSERFIRASYESRSK